MKYRHDYSQHFLQNAKLVHELIGHTNIKKRDTVVDIGAGSGIISAALSARVEHVIAIESESGALLKLRENMKHRANVEIIDASFDSSLLPNHPYKVFSNIPFNLSSAIVWQLVTASNSPTSIYLVVQKQFARKLLVDRTDNFKSMLGVQIAPVYQVRIRKPLRRTDFWPPPNVDTVLLELKRRDTPLVPIDKMSTYTKLVERSFTDITYFRSLTRDTDSKPSGFTLDMWIKILTPYL